MEVAAFDRTYEGLKLFFTTTPKAPSQAFDRTYEGLKRRKVLKHLVLPPPLLTVPMRV